jgi:acetolactate decarboxylase
VRDFFKCKPGIKALALPAIVLITVMLLVAAGGCAGSPAVDRDTLFQVSTINALMAGSYDGVMSLGSLGKYGDFGLGTFARLDGEMVGLDGKFYQVRTDGKAYLMSGSVLTPFACVTYFATDRTLDLAEGLDYTHLTAFLDSRLPTVNIFYAIKIEGTFSYVKTRSVPPQEKPYPPLAEVTKNQSVFEFNDVKGTVVGFRCPPYVTGVNVAGYHLHFLTADKSAGGHVLELTVGEAKASIDDTPEFLMRLPGPGSDFYQLDLSQPDASAVGKVEK